MEIREGGLDLEDLKEMKWKVITGQAEVMPMVVLKNGEIVRFVGEKINTSTFEARRIMPWQKPRLKKPNCLGGEFCKVK